MSDNSVCLVLQVPGKGVAFSTCEVCSKIEVITEHRKLCCRAGYRHIGRQGCMLSACLLFIVPKQTNGNGVDAGEVCPYEGCYGRHP